MKRFGLACLAIGLFALLSAAAPPPPMPRYPMADEALVYFYHVKNKERDNRAYWMKLDGKKVAKLDIAQYTFAYVKPGSYTANTTPIMWEPGFKADNPDVPLKFEGGKIYYFRFRTDAHRLDSMAAGRQLNSSPILEEVGKETGLSEMRWTTYRAPEADWPLTR